MKRKIKSLPESLVEILRKAEIRVHLKDAKGRVSKESYLLKAYDKYHHEPGWFYLEGVDWIHSIDDLVLAD
jgi:hypothetical protein